MSRIRIEELLSLYPILFDSFLRLKINLYLIIIERGLSLNDKAAALGH